MAGMIYNKGRDVLRIVAGGKDVREIRHGGAVVWQPVPRGERRRFKGKLHADYIGKGATFSVRRNGATEDIPFCEDAEGYFDVEVLPAGEVVFSSLTAVDELLFLPWGAINTQHQLGCNTIRKADLSMMPAPFNPGFSMCTNLEWVDLSGNRPVLGYDTYYHCDNLKYINMAGGYADWWGLGACFIYCSKLTTVVGPLRGIRDNLSLAWAPLTRESARVFIDGLEEVTEQRAIAFSEYTYGLLTEEDITLCTSKGWTVTAY